MRHRIRHRVRHRIRHRIPFVYMLIVYRSSYMVIWLRIHMNGIPIVYSSYKVFVHIYTNNIRHNIQTIYRIRLRSHMYTNGIRTLYDAVYCDVYFSYIPVYERKPYTVTIGIPFICIRSPIRKPYSTGQKYGLTFFRFLKLL